MNKVILIGRLTKDPNMRYTPNSVPVASFTIAVDRQYKNQNGEKETDFINIVAWRKLAETVGKHLKKGARVCVCGALQTRSYEQDGVRKYITEVVADEATIIDWNGAQSSQGASSDYSFPQSEPLYQLDETDDEVPF
ncbi:MAG: single-stranded DNA-binding protein [Clostridiales bacterium]|nr:single-stranded DNA-binding protein [Clostridiales bacterium]